MKNIDLERPAQENLNWYPGHMTKAKRMMQENVQLVDLIIELLDARIPFSSRNPDIDTLGKNKSRLILLNKADLADSAVSRRWEAYFLEKGYFVVLLDSRSRKGMQSITQNIAKACQEKIERDRKRGILNRPVRAMVVGIPNVGKSTFINSYAGRACAKTGNRPGVTKGKQWIRLNKNVELLDTPGILWPKFEDQTVGEHLALIGSMNDEILQLEDLACKLIAFLQEHYPRMLTEKYGLTFTDSTEKESDSITLLAQIAQKRGCIMRGSELDFHKAAKLVLEDFRSGRIGRISLEMPEQDDAADSCSAV